jgi:hypothetical protein
MDSDVKGRWWVTFPNHPEGRGRHLVEATHGHSAGIRKAAELARRYPRAGKPVVRFFRHADATAGDVRCDYNEPWVYETCAYVKGDCPRHGTAQCATCGQPADHGCAHTSQFVCGAALCSNPQCAATHRGRH